MRRLTALAPLLLALVPASASAAPAGPGCDRDGRAVVEHRAGAIPASGRAPRPLVRCVVRPGHHATEVTLAVDPDGTVVTGLTASGGGGDVMRSADDGATWRRARTGLPGAGMGWIERDPASGRMFASSISQVDEGCTPGSDPPSPLEPSSPSATVNPKVPFSDVFAYSDDRGRTWRAVHGQLCNGGDWGKTFVGPAATAAHRAALDRRGLKNVVYHCMGATIDVTRSCWRSLDGGSSFKKTKNPAASQFPVTGQLERVLGECTETRPPGLPASVRWPDPHFLIGNGVVGADGTIYVPGNACGGIILATSRDDGDTWSIGRIPVARGRGWYSHGDTSGFVAPPNAGLPTRPQQPFKNAYGEAGMSALYSQQFAIDRDGTIYFTWVDARDDLPYLSISRDGAKTWRKPLMVAAPGVRLASTSAIAVDRPGRVAITYYGSRDRLRYDGFLAYTADARAARPRFESAGVSPARPLLPNGVSEPTEYTGVDFGPDGLPWASFARDTCTIDESSVATQCDGALNYDWPRFQSVVARLADARGGCLNGRAGARGRRLGAAVLGRTRSRQRRAFRGKRLRARGGIDRYCAAGGGSLRVGYPTRRLRRGLGRSLRARVRGRAVLILTSSRRFSVAGVRPGMAARSLRGTRRLRVGRNVWLISRGTRVYKVRAGRVREVGIADSRLTATPGGRRRFLRAWDLRR